MRETREIAWVPLPPEGPRTIPPGWEPFGVSDGGVWFDRPARGLTPEELAFNQRDAEFTARHFGRIE